MELVNELYRSLDETGDAIEPGSPHAFAVDEALDVLVRLLAPFAPHLAEEMHARRGGQDLVCLSSWPVHDPALLVEDSITLPVQINGKRRAQIDVPRGSGEEAVLAAAREEATVKKYLDAGELQRVILVPDRLLNLVVK